MNRLNQLAREAYKALVQCDIEALGVLFNRIRTQHEQLDKSVSSDTLDMLFDAAQDAGALGGRYCGAGGRGALLFVCRPGERDRIATSMQNMAGTPIPFELTYNGVHAWYGN